MINMKNVLTALRIKGRDAALSMGLQACYGGRDANGDIFDDTVNESYIRFDLMTNEIDRRGIADNESEVMLNSIYQVKVCASKSLKYPDIELLGMIDLARAEFMQGEIIAHNGTSLEMIRSDPSPIMSNDTHFYVAISVYFNTIG
jgi:hypothetical protein